MAYSWMDVKFREPNKTLSRSLLCRRKWQFPSTKSPFLTSTLQCWPSPSEHFTKMKLGGWMLRVLPTIPACASLTIIFSISWGIIRLDEGQCKESNDSRSEGDSVLQNVFYQAYNKTTMKLCATKRILNFGQSISMSI